MADTKISALTAAGSAASTDRIPIAISPFGTGDNRYLTPSQLATYLFNAPVFGAGSATAGSWPKLTSGTVQTTPDAGSIEYDGNCMYGTTDAGNRGYIPVVHFIRADTTRTLTSQTAAQAIFNSPSNGRITLETGAYFFRGVMSINTMSATSGNAQILFAGTGTFGTWMWAARSVDGNTATAATWQGNMVVTNASTASIATAGTGTVLSTAFEGTFECTAAGTWIPQIALVTANAAVVAAGSFIKLERIGSTSVASVGQWD
jgi:hypothetical protein